MAFLLNLFSSLSYSICFRILVLRAFFTTTAFQSFLTIRKKPYTSNKCAKITIAWSYHYRVHDYDHRLFSLRLCLYFWRTTFVLRTSRSLVFQHQPFFWQITFMVPCFYVNLINIIPYSKTSVCHHNNMCPNYWQVESCQCIKEDQIAICKVNQIDRHKIMEYIFMIHAERFVIFQAWKILPNTKE